MQVILRADVDNLGRLGDVVKVKPGYGRNYLVPKGIAMPATKANRNVFERERKKLEVRMEKVRQAAQNFADRLSEAHVVIPVRVGENEKLYGSVTTANIGEALSGMGLEIDRRKIVLENPIRSLGDYEVEVKLHHDVKCTVRVSVVKHGTEMKEEPEKEPATEDVQQGNE